MVNVKCKISIDTTMKKTYNAPKTLVTMVAPTTVIAESIIVDASKSGGSALTKQDQGWDLWGDDNDFDVE